MGERTSKKTISILVFILIIFSVAVVVFGVAYLEVQRKDLIHEAEQNLLNMAASKTNDILEWRKQHLNYAQTFIADPLIAEEFLVNKLGATLPKELQRIRDWLISININGLYANIAFLDNKHHIIAASALQYSIYPQDIFPSCLAVKGVKMSDVVLHPLTRKPTVYLSALFCRNSQEIGVLVFEIDLTVYFYPFIQAWPIHSHTGEILLVERAAEEVVFLNELRLKKDTALKMHFPLTQNSLESVNAVLGREGIFYGKDYRNEAVVAALRAIPETNWNMVAKIDTDEIFAPFLKTSCMVYGLISLSILIIWASFMAFIYYRKRVSVERDLLEEKKRIEIMNKYEYFLKNANDVFLVIDHEGNISEINDRAEEIYGYGREELTKMNWRDLTSDGESLPNGYLKNYFNPEGNIFEALHKNKNGDVFPVEVSSRYIKFQNRMNIQCIIRNISERKKTEAELFRAKTEAESANKVKSMFVSTMSHEIRTPMMGIIGMLDMLQTTKLDSMQKEWLNTMSQSADLLLRIVNDVLDFSKIEAGLLEIEQSPFELRECVGQVINLYAHTAKEKGLSLNLYFDEGVPSRLIGDYFRLQQVLGNLISNAIKFSKDSEIKIHIYPGYFDKFRNESYNKPGENRVPLTFSVKDGGIGISEKNLRLLFQPFFQVDHFVHKMNAEGSGLGLPIAKRLVEIQGGEIGVESKVGQGSVFWFTIPFLVDNQT